MFLSDDWTDADINSKQTKALRVVIRGVQNDTRRAVCAEAIRFCVAIILLLTLGAAPSDQIITPNQRFHPHRRRRER